MAGTIGAGVPIFANVQAGAANAGGGSAAANNAAGYYQHGVGTASQVANGLNNFVQGGSDLLGFNAQGGGSGTGGTINPMPKFNSPILAKAQTAYSGPSGELSASGGSKKRLASIFDDDGGDGGE
jgi:hypothetical protein